MWMMKVEPEGMKGINASEKQVKMIIVKQLNLIPGELEYVYEFPGSGKRKSKIVYYEWIKTRKRKKFTAELVVAVRIPWTPIEPIQAVQTFSTPWR